MLHSVFEQSFKSALYFTITIHSCLYKQMLKSGICNKNTLDHTSVGFLTNRFLVKLLYLVHYFQKRYAHKHLKL